MLQSDLPKSQFRYENCLTSTRTAENVTTVVFDISRYGKYTHYLLFKEPVNQQQAISKVEDFLSEPLTEEYYNQIKEDLFDDPMPFDEAKDNYENRGACLTDARFLEIANFDRGTLTLLCGS